MYRPLELTWRSTGNQAQVGDLGLDDREAAWGQGWSTPYTWRRQEAQMVSLLSLKIVGAMKTMCWPSQIKMEARANNKRPIEAGLGDTCWRSRSRDKVTCVNIAGNHTFRNVLDGFPMWAWKPVVADGGECGIIRSLRTCKAKSWRGQWRSGDRKRVGPFDL